VESGGGQFWLGSDFWSGMTTAWAINGRYRAQTMSGVQRVAAAYVARLSTPHVVRMPQRWPDGLRGHAWEQFILPKYAHDLPLWSPCNTGPVSVSRQIVTIHDAAVFDHPEWFSRSFVLLYRAVVPLLARRCMKIVTVSAFSRSRLVERLGISPAKVDVIWNGVEGNYAPYTPEELRPVKAKFGLEGRRYFACLSTLEPRKNLSLVLQAWSLARPRLPKDMMLLVMGKKGSSSVFRSAALPGTDASVQYTGYVDENHLPALLSGAEALLYPSLYEGFGLPIAEAMACGTPVMTSSRSSIPEVAADAGIYVDADDPADLAEQLVRMAQSPAYREEYSGRGLERAKLFSWSDAAGRMDRLLQDMG
jgi:glycosyltransferase involved in cell wall biosynthesis